MILLQHMWLSSEKLSFDCKLSVFRVFITRGSIPGQVLCPWTIIIQVNVNYPWLYFRRWVGRELLLYFSLTSLRTFLIKLISVTGRRTASSERKLRSTNNRLQFWIWFFKDEPVLTLIILDWLILLIFSCWRGSSVTFHWGWLSILFRNFTH